MREDCQDKEDERCEDHQCALQMRREGDSNVDDGAEREAQKGWNHQEWAQK